MIDQVMSFVKDQLSRGLQGSGNPALRAAEPQPDPVVFLTGEDLAPISFPMEAISLLLVNVEHDRLTRPADPFRRSAPDRTPQAIKPDVRIDLAVLFVARFNDYHDTLQSLSAVIQFFQQHPAFMRDEHPELPDVIAKLLVEPVALTLKDRNEVWNALRTTYQPSMLYRLRTLVFQDQQPVAVPVCDTLDISIKNVTAAGVFGAP